MSKSDLNGERSQCWYTGLLYCSITHREAGIPACHTEMVNMCMHAYVCIYLHVYGCEAWIMTSKLEKQLGLYFTFLLDLHISPLQSTSS